jgi:hypothetical protein
MLKLVSVSVYLRFPTACSGVGFGIWYFHPSGSSESWPCSPTWACLQSWPQLARYEKVDNGSWSTGTIGTLTHCSSIDHHLSGQSIYTLTQFHSQIDMLTGILDWSVYHITINTSLLSLCIHHFNGFCLHIRFTPWSVFKTGRFQPPLMDQRLGKNS